jgi:hypothetical protein
MSRCPLGNAAAPAARVGLALLLSFVLGGYASPERRRWDPGEFTPPIPDLLRTPLVRVGDACVHFEGSISESWREIHYGNFFHSLQRIDTTGGPTFRKGSEIVTDFPDRLYLSAYAFVARCSEDLKAAGPWPNAAPDFVKGLRAEAAYARDLHLHRLEIAKVEEALLWWGPGLPGAFPTWYYMWVLKTNGVRLTDLLVVDLLSKDGRNMGRFTVDLAGRTGTTWYHWRDKGRR